MNKQQPLTIGDVAQHFAVKTWQVRRLYERGILPDPPRAGLYRLVKPSDLPRIESALKSAGYLRAAATAAK